MEHDWKECPPVRFHQEDSFIECSLRCSSCGARVPPDWPDDFMMRLAWDVPEACEGPGFVQESMVSEI